MKTPWWLSTLGAAADALLLYAGVCFAHVTMDKEVSWYVQVYMMVAACVCFARVMHKS